VSEQGTFQFQIDGIGLPERPFGTVSDDCNQRSAEMPVEAKQLARRKARAAVRAGKLTRQPCERCGDPKADAHHEDYSKPLDVRWLCRKHHAVRHCELDLLAIAHRVKGTTTDPDVVAVCAGLEKLIPAGARVRTTSPKLKRPVSRAKDLPQCADCARRRAQRTAAQQRWRKRTGGAMSAESAA
jgi:hypothetical protein